MRAAIRLGTRGSKLALAQADLVATALRTAHPALTIEIVTIRTTGDRRAESLHLIGGQGAFTRELEAALLSGEIDVAVHSLKDLPTTLPPGLVLAATPAREDTRDVLIANDRGRAGSIQSQPEDAQALLEALPAKSRIGTGSRRRSAQLLRFRPDLEIADIRGNVDTRLRKLDEGQYDAIVLAAAGLRRLNLEARISAYVPHELLVPAPGQAALGLECRADDIETTGALSALNDPATYAAVTAERAVLRAFGVGCQLPIAALAQAAPEDGASRLRLHARVLDLDGSVALDARDDAPFTEAEALGERVAEALRAQGADRLLERSRQATG